MARRVTVLPALSAARSVTAYRPAFRRRPDRARLAPVRPVTVRRATRLPARVTVTVTLAGTESVNDTTPARVSRGAPDRSGFGARGDECGVGGAEPLGAPVVAEQPLMASGTLREAC